MTASKAKTLGQRVATLARIRPRHLLPRTPQIAEPTTGETMGQATERMAKENGITRGAQDEWALRSHHLAAAGTDDGRLTAEIAPCYAGPGFERLIDRDNGIRADTTLAKLAALKPVFDRRFGTLTAGNSSPLTDGASAVLVMSEERARADGLEPLGRIRSYAFTAPRSGGQLLAGPAYAAPIALDRAGVTHDRHRLMEMHEAFAAQVLSTCSSWTPANSRSGNWAGPRAVGHPPLENLNVMGGSVAIGHPFAATGGRVTITLLNEMRRRDVELGIVTVCAAGGMGFAMVLERV